MVDPFFTIFTGTSINSDFDRSPVCIRLQERLLRHAIGTVLAGNVWGGALLINETGRTDFLSHACVFLDEADQFGFVPASAGDDSDDRREKKRKLAQNAFNHGPRLFHRYLHTFTANRRLHDCGISPRNKFESCRYDELDHVPNFLRKHFFKQCRGKILFAPFAKPKLP